jgi:hypothetical protein
LADDDLREIDRAVSELVIQGERYPAAVQKTINR